MGSNDNDESETRSTAQEDTVGPDISQEDLDKAGEKMDGLNARYETGARECVTLEGTGGTVSGTAFADFEDDKQSDDTQSDKNAQSDEKSSEEAS